MAFRLPLDDLRRGVAGMAQLQLERLGKAVQQCEPALEQRKRLKKLRALLSLGETSRNTRDLRRCDRMLRDAGRALGSVRDNAARETTLNGLVGLGLVTRPGLEQALREELGQPNLKDMPKLDTDAMADRLSRLDLHHVTRQTVIDAAAIGYKSARRGLECARDHGTSDALHDWRKTVQRHARHMQLLGDLWPADLEMRSAVAKDLARGLGDEHDLHVFAVWISTCTVPRGEREALALLRKSVIKQQLSLRPHLHALGGRLFAEKPRHFRLRIAVYGRHHAAPNIAHGGR